MASADWPGIRTPAAVARSLSAAAMLGAGIRVVLCVLVVCVVVLGIVVAVLGIISAGRMTAAGTCTTA